MLQKKDYAESGLSIRAAFLDDAKLFPRQRRPENNFILWGGAIVRTSLQWTVPKAFGLIRIQFKKRSLGPRQGFDVKIDGGALISSTGERFPHLRTWADEKYEDVLEYAFDAPDKSVWLWNCYELHLPNGIMREEKWTENAGFWVEKLGEQCVVLHCSHGGAVPPDFESLVVQVETE